MQCTVLIDYKKLSAGGDDHHFRVIQLPYNLSIQDAATINSQVVKGKRMSLLSAAQQLGISVVASASLMQVSLKYITLLVYHGNCKQSMTKCLFFVFCLFAGKSLQGTARGDSNLIFGTGEESNGCSVCASVCPHDTGCYNWLGRHANLVSR